MRDSVGDGFPAEKVGLCNGQGIIDIRPNLRPHNPCDKFSSTIILSLWQRLPIMTTRGFEGFTWFRMRRVFCVFRLIVYVIG